jgi:aspartyl/asparaginyl-tRNA synthetase
MSSNIHIGESISHFQSALIQNGDTLEKFIKQNYVNKWISDEIWNILSIRTTVINAMHSFLVNEGLFNLERVSLSPVTDPLAHDVEHTPFIDYRGHNYKTTHSMIYSKFLACFNPKIKGIFVDSPNIRLELPAQTGMQRGKYLIDFSQMDIEIKREERFEIEEYKNNPKKVESWLIADFEKAIDFFERLICFTMDAVTKSNENNLTALDIVIERPVRPFPRFRKDEVIKKYGPFDYEKKLGEEIKSQFFWITGLMRENYDLIYPYLLNDGTKIPISDFNSQMIYNYDICAQSISLATGKKGTAYEIASGALREWLFEPIVERLIDNRVLKNRPILRNGIIENIEEMGGYGPFLFAVSQKGENNECLFPPTFGGGIGIERTLFALLQGSKVSKIDDLTFFGKNPDSYPLFLF